MIIILDTHHNTYRLEGQITPESVEQAKTLYNSLMLEIVNKKSQIFKPQT